MLLTLRQSDGTFPVVMITTLVCLAVLFWRVTLLILFLIVVALAVYGFVAIRQSG